jgi:hypothetical protein
MSETKEKLNLDCVMKRYFLKKDKFGNWILLNELEYEKKLIYG